MCVLVFTKLVFHKIDLNIDKIGTFRTQDPQVLGECGGGGQIGKHPQRVSVMLCSCDVLLCYVAVNANHRVMQLCVIQHCVLCVVAISSPSSRIFNVPHVNVRSEHRRRVVLLLTVVPP